MISDTHELHRELTIPPCDLLMHCGDWSFFSKSPRAMDDFNVWLGEQPARYRAIGAGNHEFAVEADPEGWRRRITNGTLLLNESLTVCGLNLFASPNTSLWSGAFGLSNEVDRIKLYDTSLPEPIF